jgi:glutaredoxin 3
MNSARPVLYTKLNCPWSDEVRAILDRHGVAYDERIATTDPAVCLDMMRVSGQTKAPVLDWSGQILADVGPEEVEAFLLRESGPARGASAMPARPLSHSVSYLHFSNEPTPL